MCEEPLPVQDQSSTYKTILMNTCSAATPTEIPSELSAFRNHLCARPVLHLQDDFDEHLLLSVVAIQRPCSNELHIMHHLQCITPHQIISNHIAYILHVSCKLHIVHHLHHITPHHITSHHMRTLCMLAEGCMFVRPLQYSKSHHITMCAICASAAHCAPVHYITMPYLHSFAMHAMHWFVLHCTELQPIAMQYRSYILQSHTQHMCVCDVQK